MILKIRRSINEISHNLVAHLILPHYYSFGSDDIEYSERVVSLKRSFEQVAATNDDDAAAAVDDDYYDKTHLGTTFCVVSPFDLLR